MTGKYYLAGVLLIAAALVATVVAYPHLPSLVARHWDIHGQPNGYSPKGTLYFIPGLMAGMMLLTWLLPWLSPKQFEVESFRSTYMQIMLIMIGLLAYCDAVILWIGVGHSVNVRRAIFSGLCFLFILLGNVMGKVRRNFYIGVRTPWALASERVWNATHRLAAKTMVVGGLVGMALLAGGLDGWPAFAALMAGAFIPVLYSLYFYKQLERRGELGTTKPKRNEENKMNHRDVRRAVVALVWIAVAVPLSAQNDMRGHWSGSIETPRGALTMEVDLDRVASGWIGSVTIPAQGATGVPLDAISFNGGKGSFHFQGTPGDPTFTGTLSTDGKIL